jgi:hypothetical protein
MVKKFNFNIMYLRNFLVFLLVSVFFFLNLTNLISEMSFIISNFSLLSIDLRRFLNFLVLFNISFLLNLTRNLTRTYIFIIMGFGIDFFFLSNFSASFFGCNFALFADK